MNYESLDNICKKPSVPTVFSTVRMLHELADSLGQVSTLRPDVGRRKNSEMALSIWR